MKNVETLLKDISLKEKDTIVVAVSGGPDSMALLHMLYQFQKKYPFTYTFSFYRPFWKQKIFFFSFGTTTKIL